MTSDEVVEECKGNAGEGRLEDVKAPEGEVEMAEASKDVVEDGRPEVGVESGRRPGSEALKPASGETTGVDERREGDSLPASELLPRRSLLKRRGDKLWLFRLSKLSWSEEV